ncbi:MAG: YcjF family protein [Xanthobacteraceae bacterium]
MSVRDHRRPAAFRLDDPHVVVTSPDEPPARGNRATVLVTPEPDAAALPVVVERPLRRRRGLPWGSLFWSALAGLVALGFGLAVVKLVEDLFARSEPLGYFALALATLAAIALAAVAAREAAGLIRLNAVERLRERADTAIATDDREVARGVVQDLLAVERQEPRLARARSEMQTHLGEIIDGADLVRLAERELMAPLDQDARRLVAAAAKRVSVVTAVSPRAAVDMAFVFITVIVLVRRLADLYGARPGALGLVRLLRLTITHLAVTGGMAASDSLIQQVLGHGVAAKVSARLGEGVLNGLLTARLGLAAIEVARPLPFAALPKPAIGDLAGDLITRKAPENPS